MRIPSANIPAPAVKPALEPQSRTASPSLDRRQAQAADRYAKNTQPQVIDAEYVESYSPGPDIPDRDGSETNPATAAVSVADSLAAPSRKSAHPKVDTYQQLADPATPRPGSFIDIFA